MVPDIQASKKYDGRPSLHRDTRRSGSGGGVLQACAYTCTYKRVCTDKRMDANKQETCRQSGTSQDMRLSIACTVSRDCCCSIRSEISSPATSSPTFLALVDRPRSTTCTHPQDRAREREREDERPRQRKCQIESRELGIQQSLQLTQQYSSVYSRATIRECKILSPPIPYCLFHFAYPAKYTQTV